MRVRNTEGCLHSSFVNYSRILFESQISVDTYSLKNLHKQKLINDSKKNHQIIFDLLITMYNGDSKTWTTDIWTLQHLNTFYWEQNFAGFFLSYTKFHVQHSDGLFLLRSAFLNEIFEHLSGVSQSKTDKIILLRNKIWFHKIIILIAFFLNYIRHIIHLWINV